MDREALLSKVFLFESLSREEREAIASVASLKQVKAGALLFSEGDKADAFFVILSGRMKVFKLGPKGDEQLLHVQGPMELVAEAAIFDRQVYPAHGQALEDLRVLAIPREGFVTLLRRHPEAALKMLGAYSKRLRSFVAMIEDLTLRDVRQRLGRYLLKHSRPVRGRRVCSLTVSKKELASLLGTIPETLSRTLAALKSEGILLEKGRDLIVLDRARLEA